MLDVARQRLKADVKAVAERFGVSERTIGNLVAAERGAYVSRAQHRREQIIALHRRGLTQVAIAALLEVSQPLVSRRISQARHAGTDLNPVCDDLPQTDI